MLMMTMGASEGGRGGRKDVRGLCEVTAFSDHPKGPPTLPSSLPPSM